MTLPRLRGRVPFKRTGGAPTPVELHHDRAQVLLSRFARKLNALVNQKAGPRPTDTTPRVCEKKETKKPLVAQRENPHQRCDTSGESPSRWWLGDQ